MLRLLSMLLLVLLPTIAQAADLALVLRPRDEGGPITEVWRRDALDWRRAAQRRDTLIAVGPDLWRVTTEPASGTYNDCWCLNRLYGRLDREPTLAEERSCSHKGTWMRPVAVRVGDGLKRTLSDNDPDLTGEDGMSEPIFELLGVAGTKVLLVGRHFSYACGAAHGEGSAELSVTDLATGLREPLWTTEEELRVAGALRPTLIEKAVAAGMQTREEFDDLPIIGAPALRPRWTGLRFTPDWLLSWWACFADSDGIWRSYSRSLWLPAGAAMPAALSTYNLSPALAGLTVAAPDAVAVGLVPRGLLPAEK